jgi:glycosyltransferase involved in cell wall biosynthesis
LILVDDGSTDGSDIICDEYAKKDNRIRVIHKENGGIGKARNAGVEVATGEYLAFIDSDDCIKETFIEELYKLLKETGSDIAGCRFYRNVPNTTDYVYPKESEDYNFVTDSEGIMKRLYNDMGVFCVVWNKLYKKDIIKKHPFTDVKIAEDAYSNCPIDLTLSLFKNASNTIYSISFLSSIMSRMSQISKIIITEFKSENHSAESFGKAIGELIYSIISNDTISLENYNSDMGYEIIEGIFDGLTLNKSVLKCKDSIVKGKDDLLKVFFDITDALKNPKEDEDLMTLIFMKLLGITGLITDCRLFY